MKTLRDAQRMLKANDPPIEVNQIWECKGSDGKVARRIRILAPHPDGDWIYCDMPSGKLMVDLHTPKICPELNLRYVYDLTEHLGD